MPEETYQVDDKYYAFCPDEKALEDYAIDGGWCGIEELEQETGVPRDVLIGRWFLVLDRHVMLK